MTPSVLLLLLLGFFSKLPAVPAVSLSTGSSGSAGVLQGTSGSSGTKRKRIKRTITKERTVTKRGHDMTIGIKPRTVIKRHMTTGTKRAVAGPDELLVGLKKRCRPEQPRQAHPWQLAAWRRTARKQRKPWLTALKRRRSFYYKDAPQDGQGDAEHPLEIAFQLPQTAFLTADEIEFLDQLRGCGAKPFRGWTRGLPDDVDPGRDPKATLWNSLCIGETGRSLSEEEREKLLKILNEGRRRILTLMVERELGPNQPDLLEEFRALDVVSMWRVFTTPVSFGTVFGESFGGSFLHGGTSPSRKTLLIFRMLGVY